MKPFDVEKAKAQGGKGLITRSGSPARIVCWDVDNESQGSILALVRNEFGDEVPYLYNEAGEYEAGDEHPLDLFMAPTKHEGWINVYDMPYDKRGVAKTIFDSEEEAKKMGEGGGYEVGGYYIATIHIEWEE